MALVQKYLGRFPSLSIALANSSKIRFFRSTTPFFGGVLEAEKLFTMPFLSQYFSNRLFSSSPPWSLQITTIFKFILFWNNLANCLKSDKVLYLLYKTWPNKILSNNLQSKIHNSYHICSSFVMDQIIWRISRGLNVETMVFNLNETLVCFLIWHASHKWYFENFIFGRPITKSFEVTLFSKSKLMWARLLCHNQEFSLMLARHLVPTKDASSKLSI